jgi:hypothetical protein
MDDDEINRIARLVVAVDNGEGDEDELRRTVNTMGHHDIEAVMVAVKLMTGQRPPLIFQSADPVATTSNGFKREIDELVRDAEAWCAEVGFGPGAWYAEVFGPGIRFGAGIGFRQFPPEHMGVLKGYVARANAIEQRLVGTDMPDGEDYLARVRRVGRVRTNLETLVRLAESGPSPRYTTALEGIRVALEGFTNIEKLAMIRAAYANVIAEAKAEATAAVWPANETRQ